MKTRFLFALSFLLVGGFVLSQCPTGGGTLSANTTISSNCTVTGNLVFQGPTLTIDPGVTLTVTGNITIQAGATISASGTSIINIGGNFVDNWDGGGTNTISGGTYNITGDLNESSGGNFTLNNVTVNATNINTSGGANMVIENGSVVSITGAFSNQENLTIDNATLDIGGDLDATGGDLITITNGGELLVGGDYTMNSGGGVQLSLTGGGLVRIDGDVDSSTGGNAINVDDNSGISVSGTFTGGTPPDVTVGTGDDDTDCLTGGGCCGDATACSSATVLPVSLVDFSCTLQDYTVEIDWSTASELNNDYFTIEHSNDGINFAELVRIPGKGTTNELSIYNYSKSITSQASGFLYYRLSQTDFDGTHEVLGIDQVQLRFSGNYFIYPNPVQVDQSITLEGVDQSIEWSIYSIGGKQIMSGKGTQVELNGLEKGAYFLRPDDAGMDSKLLLVK